MDIALVFDGLHIGGIERVGADYAELLSELGHEVTVINLRPDAKEMVEEYPPNCNYFEISFPRWLAPEQYAKLIKMHGAGRFIYPVIYTFTSAAVLIYKAVSRFRKDLRRKFDLVVAFSGHYNDLTFAASHFVNTKKTLCWLHGALYSYMLVSDGYYNLYKKIKNLVTLVDDAQEEVLSYNRKTELNIHKLYNPVSIDKKSIDQEKTACLKEKYGKYLVMVSRFKYPHKDQFTVAAAVKECRDKYGDDINLVFIGDGPDKAKVEQYVSELDGDVKAHIFFEGSRMDIQNYYASAYMLVHASVAGEGLPTVMLEAMSFDLPMVVTDSKTGPREILGENEYGLLCKVKDPSDMASKIHRLYTDNDLYEYYQAQGRKRIEDFNPETIKIQLKKVIDNICPQ